MRGELYAQVGRGKALANELRGAGKASMETTHELALGASQGPLCDIYRDQVEAREHRRKNEHALRTSESAAALAKNDTDAENYIRLASCYYDAQQYDDAFVIARKGLARCSSRERLYLWLIKSLDELNRTEETIQLAAEASRLYPKNLLFKFYEALTLPIVYHRPEDIDLYRGRISARLAELAGDLDLSTPEARKDALAAVSKWTNFYLAYQGCDDVDLQRLYGRLVERVMAANYPQWRLRLPMPEVPSGGKLRVGYVSAHFRTHTVSKNHIGWLRRHDPRRVEIYAYSMSTKRDHVTAEVDRMSARFWQYSGDFEAACQAILTDRLHVIVYLDIGMSPIMTMLAALRLAPVQCVAWGHPITSGLPAQDYFLSSDLMEPDKAEAYYSEKLIRLPGIGMCYEKPVIPRALFYKTRSHFGIDEGSTVYLSCQSTFKYLPQHDHVFAEIASRVPNAQFVFLTINPCVKRDFERRLERAFTTAGLKSEGRCILLPQQDSFSYWNINAVSDVYLDSIEWSGGTTTMEAIACKLPVVTIPGRFMRGRHSCAMLTQLGVTQTIARNKEEYVSIAARLGLDPVWRRRVVERMVGGYPRLYGDSSSVTALEEFYGRIVNEHVRGKLESRLAGPGRLAVTKPVSANLL